MCEIKNNFEKLVNDVNDCIKLRIDIVKIAAVEEVALLLRRLLIFVLLLVSLLFAMLFLFVALTMVLVPCLGVVNSCFAMALLFFIIAVSIYLMRRLLFVNTFIKPVCAIFFKNVE